MTRVILDEKTVEYLKEELAEMHELYRQMKEGADTGFDADDIAIEIANFLGDLIEQAEDEDWLGRLGREIEEMESEKKGN